MLLFLEHPTPKAGVLPALSVGAMCRYFAFYVTRHSVDPRDRFTGLGSAGSILDGSETAKG